MAAVVDRLRKTYAGEARVMGLILLLAIVIAPRASISAAEPTPSAKDRAETFAWFSELGYPDVKQAKFVRVATGRTSQSGTEPPQNQYRHGFLLSETGDRFKVLFPDLETTTFSKSPPGTAEHQRIGFEDANLRDFATHCLADAKQVDFDPRTGFRRFGERLAERAELFVLAWACSLQGESKAAEALFNHVSQMEYRRVKDKKPFTLRQELEADLSLAEIWRAVLQFGDPTVPRAQLLPQFERIARNFPDSEHFKNARDTAALLKKMVQEDKEHAQQRQAGKPFDQLSPKEQIAELIFQLRDQNGEQWSQPGACDIFLNIRGGDDTPAHLLVKRGYDAVPQLIEALDNDRFTRSVGYHRDFYFSHTVLRVSDCAERILVRIAGRSFYERTYTNGYMHKDAQAAAVKKQVTAWYAELQKKGEKQLLVEGVERGDDQSPYQAQKLLEKYADAALPALIAGARKAKDSWVRESLVAGAGGLEGNGPVEFLLDELKRGPAQGSRLAAAQALHARGRPEGVAAMIEEWTRPRDKETDDYRARGENLVSFLANSGKLEAIEALAHNFGDRPVGQRLDVVSALRAGSFTLTSNAERPAGDANARPTPKEVQTALRKLFLVALDDLEQRTGMSGVWDNKRFSDPRICDIAGHMLNGHDPARYRFDLEASLPERERARFALKNVMRAELGLPALPTPQPKIIKPVAKETLAPLVAQFEAATGDAERSAESAILKLGLGALPEIAQRRNQLPAQDPRRAKLAALASRLALLIVDVEIAEKSLRPDAALAERLALLKGSPLSAKNYLALVSSLTEKLPKGVEGLRWSAVRNEEGAGVTLRLDLLDQKRADAAPHSVFIAPDDKAPRDRPYAWRYNYSVQIGKDRNSSGGASTTPPGARDGDATFAAYLKALDTVSPDEPIEVRLEMTSMWRDR